MSELRILLLGSGGREATLAWKLAQSDRVRKIFVCPGNGGTARMDKCVNLPVSANDFGRLVAECRERRCNLVVPGPEDPLIAGVVDYFGQHLPAVPVFGPSAAAARLEGSKRFSKDFMKKYNIPTAAYAAFTDYDAACAYVRAQPGRVVIKADGLAQGKGVLLPETVEEGLAGLRQIMVERAFGDAGKEVVIEEFLEGEELSTLTLCDGTTTALTLPAAQDHKRALDGDRGLNTGGMGTYAPASVGTAAVLAEIERAAVVPTLAGMRAEGAPFVGCLFTGYMLTKAGVRVLEYNVRFGDPETQSVLPLLRSDLADLMLACCAGALAAAPPPVIAPATAAVTVVLASGGYPEWYPKGIPIYISDELAGGSRPDGVVLFHAGTSRDPGGSQLLTSGGRVIAVTATAPSVPEAVEKAYGAVGQVRFEGMQYRKDIARRELVRLGHA